MSKRKKGAWTREQVYGFLQSKGIAGALLMEIKAVLAEEALTNGRNLAYNRIYTAVALTARRSLHFGSKRLLRFLRDFNKVCVEVMDEDREWSDVMAELDRETGIVIRQNEETGDWLCEYKPKDGVEVDVY